MTGIYPIYIYMIYIYIIYDDRNNAPSHTFLRNVHGEPSLIGLVSSNV